MFLKTETRLVLVQIFENIYQTEKTRPNFFSSCRVFSVLWDVRYAMAVPSCHLSAPPPSKTNTPVRCFIWMDSSLTSALMTFPPFSLATVVVTVVPVKPACVSTSSGTGA